jgi:glycosyltransferase involved in cell wall biosynthesis
MTVVAYLAPEIPALSATFVYEELLGVERRGVRVLPVTVRAPQSPAAGLESLAQRTRILYDRAAALLALDGLVAAVSFGRRMFGALACLRRDMVATGLFSSTAWKLAYQWLAGARLARLLQREGCTHLHIHFAHTPTQIGMYACAFSGTAFTVMAHANDIFERGLLLPEKARRSAKLLTISHYNVAYLRSVGVPDDKLAVVRCGVSFAARPRAAPFERRASYRIGTLGRLVEKKGVDDLIRAVALLRDAPWRVDLHIAGDGPERARLEALVRQLGLADSVHFDGALAHHAVTAWLQSLDAFAMGCKADAHGDQDGIPVALMEAMSQQVPVVSTRLSGIPELVVHETTGLLAEPADPASLAGQLRRLLDDPALRTRLADAALQHVQTEFGQDVNLDRLLHHIASGRRE